MLKKFILLSFIICIFSCSTEIDPTKKKAGFLPSYDLLKPVPGPEGIKIFAYTNPQFKRSDYHAVILMPVRLYQTAVESGVTAEQIENTRKYIDNKFATLVPKNITITDKPAPGVARAYLGITGAILENEGFKPRNIVPISAAIKLASMATNLDNKQPTLIIEIKIVDSQSGKLLKEIVSIVSGENFHMSVHTAEEFQKLAADWISKIISYTANK